MLLLFGPLQSIHVFWGCNPQSGLQPNDGLCGLVHIHSAAHAGCTMRGRYDKTESRHILVVTLRSGVRSAVKMVELLLKAVRARSLLQSACAKFRDCTRYLSEMLPSLCLKIHKRGVKVKCLTSREMCQFCVRQHFMAPVNILMILSF